VVTLSIEGPTKSYNSKSWYYDSSNTKLNFIITSENNSFTKTLKVGNETVNLTNVTPSNNTYTYSIKLSDISNINNYGENTSINASITLLGKTIPVTKTINVDFTTPINPALTASDELASGKWHAEDFDLNVSGGGTSPSGAYYMYGYDKSTINTKVDGTSIPVSANGSFTIYVKTCNNVGRCSSYTEYKTIKSVTLTSAKVVITYGEYFEDSIVSIEDVKYEEGDTKLKQIYYMIGKRPKTIEEFIELNPSNSNRYNGTIRQSSYFGRIALVDTAGNVQMYNIGWANPGAIRSHTTVNKEYNFSLQYISTSYNYVGIGAYDELSGKLLQSKNFKFENNKLEYTILSTGAAEYKQGYITEPGVITFGTVSGCMNSNLSSSWSCPHGGSPKKVDGKWMCTLDNGNYEFSYCYDKYGNKLENCTDARAPWSMPGFENVYFDCGSWFGCSICIRRWRRRKY